MPIHYVTTEDRQNKKQNKKQKTKNKNKNKNKTKQNKTNKQNRIFYSHLLELC